MRESIVSGNQASGAITGYGGGGIFSAIQRFGGSLTIEDSSISENNATSGGGIRVNMPSAGGHTYAEGAVFTVARSRLEANEATSRGGGLYTSIGSGGKVTIENSVITGNEAGIELLGGGVAIPNSGGGVYAYLSGGPTSNPALLTIAGSEISGNTAGQHGGGLALCTKRENSSSTIARLSVYNTTISGNVAGHTTAANDPGTGGGVHLGIFGGYSDPEEALDARFQNATITGNTADQGGGIFSYLPMFNNQKRNDVRLTNSIISGNRKHDLSASNLHGSFNIAETVFNLIGQPGSGNVTYNHATHQQQLLRNEPPGPSDAASGNIFTDNPMLGELAWSGGPTRTHRPLTGSLAIDAGSNALANVPFTSMPIVALATDQRGAGFPRRFDVAGVGATPGAIVDIGAHEISTGLAKVVDVLLDGVMPDGQPWLRDPFSFAEIVFTGKQLAPIYTGGVDTLQAVFSENVQQNSLTSANVILHTSNGQTISLPTPSYDSTTHTATWTLASPLPIGKYRLEIGAGVTDLAGNALDGEWINDTNGTPDNFADDPIGGQLISGGGVAGGPFEFFFSYLPGDYNQDGLVRSSGPASDLDVIKDGNGDGVVGDAGDTNLVNANHGQRLPFRPGGDANDNDLVHVDDYFAWRASFGATGFDLAADGNGDGVVDTADYVVWRGQYGKYSAWYTGDVPDGGGSGGPIVTIGEAPRVTNVVVSGSTSVHAPYSFDLVDGSGEQLRTVPVGGADTVSMAFSEDVNIQADHLIFVGLQTANRPAVAEFTYDIFTMTATWRFDGMLANDQYAIRLRDAVTDIEGNALDGEWVNPATLTTTNALVSEFPSGDGEAGGDFTFAFTIMAGDANRTNIVDGGDYYIVSTNYNNNLTDAEFTDGDFTGDGFVDDPDFNIWYAEYGQYNNFSSLQMLADLNGDWVVDQLDLDILYGNRDLADPTQADGDLDGDGDIDLDDVDLAFAQYGLELDVVS